MGAAQARVVQPATVGLGTCCLKGEASEEQVGWKGGLVMVKDGLMVLW